MKNDNQDPSQKTEQPTQHHIEKTKEKGHVPQTRDLYHVLMFGVCLFFVFFLGRYLVTHFFSVNRFLFEDIGTRSLNKEFVSFIAYKFLLTAFKPVFYFFLLLLLVLVAGLGLQTHWRFNLQALQVDVKRVSLVQGVQRLFSTKNIVEFLKSFFKFSLIGCLVVVLGWRMFVKASAACGSDPFWGLLLLQDFLKNCLIWVVVLTALIALTDYGYQWYAWFRKLFMSRQEILDEHKEIDKNPQTLTRQKQHRRTLQQMSLAREKIPEATVLITNPTHYAVAILWQPYRMQTPQVLFKGTDSLAIYMRELAKKHNIPLVENPELARGLYKSLNVGEAIKPEHYKAVATVIRYVMNLRAKRRG